MTNISSVIAPAMIAQLRSHHASGVIILLDLGAVAYSSRGHRLVGVVRKSLGINNEPTYRKYHPRGIEGDPSDDLICPSVRH